MTSNNADPTVQRLESLQHRIRSALGRTTDEHLRRDLAEGLQLLSLLVADACSPAETTPNQFSGYVEHTFEDEDYEPHGREIDVRIHYSWHDYDRADDRSLWGATIEDVEVLAIRYFDDQGNVAGTAEHREDVAWNLVRRHEDLLTDRCTQDGIQRGAGAGHPLFAALSSTPASGPPETSDATASARMAPSMPTRQREQSRRRIG